MVTDSVVFRSRVDNCGYCNTNGTQTAAGGGSTLTDCVDANANCASWVASSNFCARSDISPDG
ncbi:hypothetical protein PRIPAC_76752 [Pristionchus pacificus]|uniref:Uncharacterized protein n=1 Tax=Pristionchus pacificus TaxID=54126 RepID=A0A2A6CMZ1_PRIPA|nr:hypothetical protein PRIPAC_76752 [Pristionchus pacificus]|eukprot:PDM79457.1 hypothetical protein PRIPAC_32036 [Pristionchus pacificus]